MAILHGGQLSRVAKQYQIPEKDWLDLSTGIAPFSYPIPDIPQQAWQNLPTISENLIEVAKAYYQTQYCWPVAGSQALIEKLPELWNDKKKYLHTNVNSDFILERHAYLPKVGYKEHQQAWCKGGYQLHFYQDSLPTDIEENSVVVVINPNNPLTDTFTIDQLKTLQNLCEQQQALLIIDEAFADIFTPEFSFSPHLSTLKQTADVLVLRSFGKFFGLAGLRVGFVCSNKHWCETIQEVSGPWAVNGAALFISEQALQDRTWQANQLKRLQTQSEVMQELLKAYLPVLRMEANALFITIFLSDAPVVYQQLCENAIYVRLTDENDSLRFGIASTSQLEKLTLRLSAIRSI
ncbi:threonine-phosphate decarboxylase [Psychromonas sp. SP041]|uniref:threonine-phosphate decarboxylase n=1 Tax=Psychromonas sp. SP041 TaxID=1365007 RepID=UPI000412BC5F|nr:threonine-phosphate decarboxylase [Psychromonas sp. SP041]